MLCDGVLAFIKAYRLKGDNSSLKSKVAERFDASLVADAKKKLWESCSALLTRAGLSYHVRRSSERCCQLVADLEDILSAFEALGAREELPDIFCEATNLLKLPPICLDPVSEKLHNTTMSLKSLASDVKYLQEELSNSLTSLKADMQNVKKSDAKHQTWN